MVLGGLVNFALRGFQAICGIVILALSITLIHHHHWGSLPASLGYGAFVGGVTIVAALVGVAATWVSFLEGWVGIIVDAVLALINLAGAVALTVKIGGANCSPDPLNAKDLSKLAKDIFVGGCQKLAGEEVCWAATLHKGNNVRPVYDFMSARCKESSADMVFMYLSGAAFIATAIVLFLRRRKSI